MLIVARRRRAWLILGWGIVILVLVDGVMLSFDPQYEPSHTNNKNNNDKRAHGPVIPVILRAVAVTEEFIETHEKLFIVLSTFAIAAFTYTLWRATSGLQTLAAKQAVDMRESLNTAKQSADAADLTVNTMQDTARRQLRAYIHVDDTPVLAHPRGGRVDLVITVTIRNFGQTPAYGVNHVVTYFIEDPSTRARIFETSEKLQKVDIGPHAPIHKTFVLDLDSRTAGAITNGEKRFVTRGRIEYRDAFGNEHITAYNLGYRGIKGVGTPGGLRAYEDDGNETT